jgi:hypothetical protein
MRQLCNIIIQQAVVWDYDVLILPPFGCGAYKNPAGKVWEFFKQAIIDHLPLDCKLQIQFAVIDDHNGSGNAKSLAEEYQPRKSTMPIKRGK